MLECQLLALGCCTPLLFYLLGLVLALYLRVEQRGACLIPFGGGTNVTDALRCPPDESRPILSVDMRRMIWSSSSPSDAIARCF